jgi:hypothetical protein
LREPASQRTVAPIPKERPLQHQKYIDSYGQKYEGDQARRHRRFYFDFNEVTQTSRAVCGPCVKTIGGRCGK